MENVTCMKFQGQNGHKVEKIPRFGLFGSFKVCFAFLSILFLSTGTSTCMHFIIKMDYITINLLI